MIYYHEQVLKKKLSLLSYNRNNFIRHFTPYIHICINIHIYHIYDSNDKYTYKGEHYLLLCSIVHVFAQGMYSQLIF